MALKRKAQDPCLVSPGDSTGKRSRPSSPCESTDTTEEIAMWQPPPSALPRTTSTSRSEIIVTASVSATSDETDGIIKPGDNDVVCKRGGRAIKNPGNALYRNLINSKKTDYQTCSQEFKTEIAMSIVSKIHGQTPAGRFLMLDPKTQLWFEIPKMKALQKTSMALAQAKRDRITKTDTFKVKIEVTDTESNGDISDCSHSLEEISELTNEDDFLPLPYNGPAMTQYDRDFVAFMNTKGVLHALFDEGKFFSR